MRTRVPNNVETRSTSIQHFSTRLEGGGGGQTVSTSLFNKIEQMLKQMLKLFRLDTKMCRCGKKRGEAYSSSYVAPTHQLEKRPG